MDGERDICEGKHGGADTSEAAFEKQGPKKRELDRTKVLKIVLKAGRTGATLKDICKGMAKPPNAVSGRVTELLKSELIVDTGKRRHGCRVYRVDAKEEGDTGQMDLF